MPNPNSGGPVRKPEPPISRRSILGGLAVAAVASPAAALTIPSSSRVSTQDAWNAFVATLKDCLSEGDRLQIYGSVSSVRAEIYRSRIEQVHPKVRMPVERIVASYRLAADGWTSEGYYE